MEIGVFSKYLKDLIIDHDKVEIPGLGIFYARFEGAHFSDNRTTIYPPTRYVVFREDEVSEDAWDLICDSVAQEASISPDDARTELEWCVSRLKTELRASKRCELPGLGVLRANSRNDFFFVADDDLDVFPDGLGLEPVCIKMNQPATEPAPAQAPVQTAASAPAPMPAPAPVPAPPAVSVPAPLPEPEEPVKSASPAKRRRSTGCIILLSALIAIAAFLLFLILAYAFRNALSPALDGITSWVDNILNHILYNEEERRILGF